MKRTPFDVLPLCPLSCGSMLASTRGESGAVVVVKATFSLLHERSAWPIAPAPLVEVDAHAPNGSLIAPSDFVPFLPSCGVLLSGAAHAPGGAPVRAMAVRLAIFRDARPLLDKMLHVFGPATAESPSPSSFTTMPITYERAYGGPGVARNPIGVSADRKGPLASIASPESRERPAGFGPIAREWSPRRDALKGYREADGRVEVPDAMPWAALHAAPEDQRIDFLRGDEWIVLDGLHELAPSGADAAPARPRRSEVRR